MDEKAVLLEQLRIHRSSQPVSAGGRRKAWIGLLIGVTAILLTVWGSVWISQAEAVPVQAAVARTVSSGAAGAPASLLDATGYVVALRDAIVSAKGIYKVNDILVQQGEVVKTGQVIARLDDSNIRAALEQSVVAVNQARAALAQARLAADDARPTFLRQQQELAEGLISQDAFDTTKASYDAARAQVAVAEQNLAVNQAAVVVNQRIEDDTVIQAPFDGIVTAKNAQPGQIVSPQFSGGGGLAEVVDMNSLEVDVDVSENFISRVHPRQPATITLDAYPEWRAPAEVIAIVPTAEKSKATVQVRVGFKQKDPRILPQMGARVSFLADTPSKDTPSGAATSAGAPSSADNTTVVIPSAAVQTHGDVNAGTIYVIKGQVVESHTVRVGPRDGDNQRILSGLGPGVTVAIGDFNKLHDGVRVRITH